MYYNKVAINFLLPQWTAKIDQLFLYHFRRSLVVCFDWQCLCKGQIISIVYDHLRFGTDNLFTIVHSCISFKRHFCIVSRALRIHVEQYIEGLNYLAGFSVYTKAKLHFAKHGFLFLSSQFQNKFFHLFQMLVIFSDVIISIKATYDVILCTHWNLAEVAHTSIWESTLAQHQQCSLL